MIIRMTFVKIKPEKKNAARKLYTDVVIPSHKNQKGCRYVYFMENLDSDEVITMTAWDTKADAEEYEHSGNYEGLKKDFKTMFAEEPMLKTYEITASSEPLLLRIF